jgi:hypothetical protein
MGSDAFEFPLTYVNCVVLPSQPHQQPLLHQNHHAAPAPNLQTMLRSALLRASRSIRPSAIRPVAKAAVRPVLVAPVKPVLPMGIRFYSAPASLSKEEVEGRIKDLLKGFDKVSISVFAKRRTGGSDADESRVGYRPEQGS